MGQRVEVSVGPGAGDAFDAAGYRRWYDRIRRAAARLGLVATVRTDQGLRPGQIRAHLEGSRVVELEEDVLGAEDRGRGRPKKAKGGKP